MKRMIPALLAVLALFSPLSSGTELWHAYFTTPAVKDSYRNADNPERGLVAAIDACSKSIDGAFYDITSPRIVDAFLRSKKRGVAVRLVTDDGNYGRRGINALMRAGIPVVTDTGKGLMHNKFAVLDERRVWTGSYNVTENGAEKNNNNAVLFESGEMAAIFTAEFNEMYEGRIFGNRRNPGPFNVLRNSYYVKLGQDDVNVYFSPDDDVERIIIKRIGKAKKSIRFMAFSFTSDPIAGAMIRKHTEGVTVEGLLEKRGVNTRYCEYKRFLAGGIPVHLDRNRFVMHHKVIIIDDETVIFGSFNYSANAAKRNDENIVIVSGGGLPSRFIEEFKRLY